MAASTSESIRSEPNRPDPFAEQCATLYGCIGELRRLSNDWKPAAGKSNEQKAASDILTCTAPLLDDDAVKVQPVGTSRLAACAAVLSAHLAITEQAITACSGSPPPELVSIREECRIEIERTWTLLQAYEATIGSQAPPVQQQAPDPAYGDAVGIVKELAEACSNAIATLTQTCNTLVSRTTDTCDTLASRTADTCDALVSRTADTCDAMATMAATARPDGPTSSPSYLSDGADDQTSNVATGGRDRASYGAGRQYPTAPAAGSASRPYGAGNQYPNAPTGSTAYASEGGQQDADYPTQVLAATVERTSGYATTFRSGNGGDETSDPDQAISGVLAELLANGTPQSSAPPVVARPQPASSTSPATALFLANVSPGYQEITRRVLGPEPASLADLDLDQIESAWNAAMAKSLSTVRDSGSPYRAVDVLELFRLGGKLRAERARYASRVGRR